MKDENIDFASLSASAKYLNKQSDTLHATLTSIQNKILKLGIGLDVYIDCPGDVIDHPARVITDQESGGRLEFGWTLALAKHNGAWCIAVRQVVVSVDSVGMSVEMNPNGEPDVPILEAPRDVRIAALKLMPALVHRLKTEADRAGKIVEEAAKEAQAIDAALA